MGKLALACFAAAGFLIPSAGLSASATLGPPPSLHAPAGAAAAAKALAKYRAAMIALPKPPNMVFTYTESRGGPLRIVTGVHRVYRDSAGYQRNDTLELNGATIRPPQTQTFFRPTWPYHADQFAAPAAEYDAAYAGIATVNGRRAFVFRVKRHDAAPFSVTELDLDASSSLPLRERFSAATPQCDGTGWIEFALSGQYWLPSAVSADCTITTPPGSQYKHTIRFADYRFPVAIPNDVLHPVGAGPQ